MTSRRRFLKRSMITALTSSGLAGAMASYSAEDKNGYVKSERLQKFKQLLTQPILDTSMIKTPVIIETINIYQNGPHYFIKVTSKDGAVGIASGNDKYIKNIYPIMINRIAKWMLKEDARNLESLLYKVYTKDLNYKWQGLAFWVGVAYIEIAILDLLGQIAKQPMANLLGGRVRDKVAIYYASGNRDNSPQEEVEYLQRLVGESGAKAVKYRLGARMRYDDASTKRDIALIPLAREALGDDATIYTDANGSYDVPMGIHIGKILEEYNTAFYEEPCPFDHYEETKAVADALDIPVAGGEEEVSMRQFMRMMDHEILNILQPDILFFGGLIRCIRVSRMAASIGVDCTPHIAGSALGFLYMMQFAACVPNIGPFQEFKGNKDKVPVESASSSLQAEKGLVDIPKEPGLGVTFDPEFIKKAKKITSI